MCFFCSSSGLLIYAALVDLLAEDFLSEEASLIMTKKDKIQAFSFVLMGGKLLTNHSVLCLFSLGPPLRLYVETKKTNFFNITSCRHVRRRGICMIR